MRVITGTLRGRKIKTVSSKTTRPTSDKVKEAAFHVMGPYFEGGEALDLFAGSGSLGIEAISRGIQLVTFIDRDRRAIDTIRRNVRQLQIDDNSHIYRNDAVKALHILSKKGNKFHLIFIDPPYKKINYTNLLNLIYTLNIAHSKSFIYLEHSPEDTITYSDRVYHLRFTREYSKTTAITILQFIG